MKLYAGIYGATIGSKTSNREEVVDKITRVIEQKLLALKKKQIRSDEISEIALRTLRDMHPRTFLRMLAYNISSESEMIREFNRYIK